MVHGVTAVRRSRADDHGDAERVRQGVDRLPRARCADECRIEVRQRTGRAAAGVSRPGSTLTNATAGRSPAGRSASAFRAAASVASVVGQMSGQFTKPKNTKVQCPRSCSGPNGLAGLVRERERGQRPRLLEQGRLLEDGRRRAGPRREVRGSDAGNQPCDHDAGDEHAIHGRELSHGRAPAGRRLDCPR